MCTKVEKNFSSLYIHLRLHLCRCYFLHLLISPPIYPPFLSLSHTREHACGGGIFCHGQRIFLFTFFSLSLSFSSSAPSLLSFHDGVTAALQERGEAYLALFFPLFLSLSHSLVLERMRENFFHPSLSLPC